jgi:hypothetical protein
MSRRRRKPSSPAPGSRSIPDILYPTFDLHGLTGVEAGRAAAGWIEQQFVAGEPVVRIITGRGMHSVGSPVLPEVIASLLRDLTGRTVQSYEREPGGGAFRVRLKRPSTVPPLEPAAVRLPVELVRLAEEALAELGIDPTPALVAAEVRRMIAERGREIS